ncbi:MAG: hypothetical protein JXM71_00965 [Spirochaetales bacterium]|nr:hypothetical protein [Spirochaetales bacterium]
MRALLVSLVLSLSAALMPLSAQTVEIVLYESVADADESRLDSSEHVIEGVLEALFDGGFIATNSRPTPGDRPLFDAFKPAKASIEGMVDFVIVVLAEYVVGSRVPSCRYKLIRVSDGGILTQGTIPAGVPRSLLRADVEQACVELGTKITEGCSGPLAGRATAWRNHAYVQA